jgi:anti-sigma factor RsiW
MSPEVEAKLSALLDGELPPGEAEALRAEIARRPELAARLAELGAVDALLRALPARPVPAGLRPQLGERIRASREASAAPRGAPRRRRRWLAAAALAAAAAALVLVALPRLREEASVDVAEDLPVIEVLDVLAELDELEPVGSS